MGRPPLTHIMYNAQYAAKSIDKKIKEGLYKALGFKGMWLGDFYLGLFLLYGILAV